MFSFRDVFILKFMLSRQKMLDVRSQKAGISNLKDSFKIIVKYNKTKDKPLKPKTETVKKHMLTFNFFISRILRLALRIPEHNLSATI